MMKTTQTTATTTRRLLFALLMMVSLMLTVACGQADPGLVHQTIDQPLEAATRGEVEIELSVGQLRIGAIDQGDVLVRGDISYFDQSRIARTFAIHGDTARFSLHEDDSQRNVLDSVDEVPVWNLQLNRTTPMLLRVGTGVGENTIDLSQLQVTAFELASGVGETTVMLPQRAGMRVELSGGIGEMTVVIPAGVPVRVESSVGIGDITMPTRYRQQGQAYVSPGFDHSAEWIELTISGGIGAITIKQDQRAIGPSDSRGD